MATIKDIARITGYSIGTVSRVMNHHQDVSDKARKEIEHVIEEQGYQPNANAKLLKQTHTSSITVFIKSTCNIFLNGMLENIQSMLKQAGEEVRVVFMDENSDEVLAAKRICHDNHPRGLLFLGADLDHFRHEYEEMGVPAVLVAADGNGLHIDSLSSYCTDDDAGARAAAEYLIDHGHRHIGLLGGVDPDVQGQVAYKRYHGLSRCLKEHNLSFVRSRQYIPCEFSLEGGYEAGKNLLHTFPEVTAVFCMSDTVAIGAMRAFSEAGRRIPEDISVIGFDGIDYSQFTVPRLTTVCQDTETIVRSSVNDLLMRIKTDAPSRHSMVPFHIVEGESVCQHSK